MFRDANVDRSSMANGVCLSGDASTAAAAAQVPRSATALDHVRQLGSDSFGVANVPLGMPPPNSVLASQGYLELLQNQPRGVHQHQRNMAAALTIPVNPSSITAQQLALLSAGFNPFYPSSRPIGLPQAASSGPLPLRFAPAPAVSTSTNPSGLTAFLSHQSPHVLYPNLPWTDVSGYFNTPPRSYLEAQIVRHMMHSSTNTSSAATLPHVKTPQPASLPILHANFPPTPFPKDTIACREDESSISCRPILLARPTDVGKLSSLQVLLRQQIEAFSATERYATTHTRGRTKPVRLGQVGIRCRHCAHIPLVAHQKGSTYFPTTVQGFYQASQNMSNMHLQNGVCVAMPQDTKNHFERLLSTKIVFSGAGRKYWTKSARELGLVDTDQGIHFEGFIPPDAHVVENAQAYSTSHVVDTNCPVASTSGSQGVCNKKRSNTTAGHKPASQKRDKV